MISNEFKENINSGDVVAVKSMLIDYLTIDRTFKKFDEGLEYTKSKMDIVQEFDNQPLETNPEKWDDEYLSKQKVLLMINFSNERIAHIKKVITKVIPQTQNNTTTGKKVISETEIKPKSVEQSKNQNLAGRRIIKETEIKYDPPKRNNDTDEILSNALIVGGGAVVVAGVVVSEPIIVSVGAVVAGAGIYLKFKK